MQKNEGTKRRGKANGLRNWGGNCGGVSWRWRRRGEEENRGIVF